MLILFNQQQQQQKYYKNYFSLNFFVFVYYFIKIYKNKIFDLKEEKEEKKNVIYKYDILKFLLLNFVCFYKLYFIFTLQLNRMF